jgi:hypothetical protein
MVEVKTTYSSNNTITLDLGLTPLASSATFTAGRESTQIDNTSNLYIDALVQGFVTVGTTPTVGSIIVYVWGSDISLATTPIDDLDGSDADRVLTNTGVLNSALRFARSIPVLETTSDIKYNIAPFSVAQLFGGIMPKFWGLFVTHDTVAALNTTSANHVFHYNGITYTSA